MGSLTHLYMISFASCSSGSQSILIFVVLQVRLDEHGRRLRGKDGEYVTPQSMRMVHDASGSVMQVDLGASMSQMSDIEEQLGKTEGCRSVPPFTAARLIVLLS